MEAILGAIATAVNIPAILAPAAVPVATTAASSTILAAGAGAAGGGVIAFIYYVIPYMVEVFTIRRVESPALMFGKFSSGDTICQITLQGLIVITIGLIGCAMALPQLGNFLNRFWKSTPTSTP